MDNTIASFLVALGFDVNQNSLNTAKRSVADYEKAVREADARVMKARADNAKAEIQINARRDADRAKEALAAAQRAQQVEKAEQEQALKRRERASEFGAALSKMALAATAAASAIAFAVNRVTGAFDTLAFISQRTGASVQSLNSLGYAFKQVGGSSQQAVGAVESFARAMRENDGVKSYVKSLGVDTTKDAAEQLLDTVEKLSKHEYQVGFREASLAGISEEDYNLITRQLGALRKYREEYDATAKRLGLNSEQAASASLAFQRALARLQTTVSIVGQNLFTQLAPAMERVAKGFNDWIANHPEKIDHILQSITRGITFLTEKMTGMVEWFAGSDGEKLTQRWDQFAARVDSVAKSLETIARFLDRISGFNLHATNTMWGDPARVKAAVDGLNGGSGGGGGIPGVGAVGGFNPTEGGGGEDKRNLWQRVAPKWLGGKDAPAAGDGSRSYRNNNPGNIKFGPFAEKMGATGKDEKGFARFPSYEAGRKAQESLLFDSDGYKGLTIRQAIARWAPAGDGNDPEGYASQMAQAAGVGADTKLSDLSANQRSRFLDAQQRKEGWIPGADTTSGPVRANLMHGQYGAAGGNLTELRSASGLRTQVHSEAHPSFAGFLKELEAQGYKVGSLGGYNYRNIRGGDKLSQHAYGNAIDLNPGSNPLGTDRSDLPANVRELAKKYGLIWGMDWKSRKDPMHFEWNGTRPWLEERKAEAAAAAQAYRKRAPALNMTPGGFNVNSINPMDAMKAPPFGALGNTTTSNDNRAVNQTFHTTTTINEARNTREAGRVMAGTFGDMHALALRNAQSAVG